MKKVLLAAITMMSLNSFAFTAITLNNDARLEETQFSHYPFYSVGAGNRKAHCDIYLSAPKSTQQAIDVRAGTTFQVTSLVADTCNNGWQKKCSLIVDAYDSKTQTELRLDCYHYGMLATRLNAEKANHLLSGIAHVE